MCLTSKMHLISVPEISCKIYLSALNFKYQNAEPDLLFKAIWIFFKLIFFHAIQMPEYIYIFSSA